jgi:RNA polymerase sigma factor (sigma-70 family)
MASGQLSGVLRYLRRTTLGPDGGTMTDGQLLECFLTRRDEAAFEALVRRHGPMVLGVCRRVLHNSHDAEDAFQATFLVLVRKAASLRQRELVGNWLYGTAYRAALEARAARRRLQERQVSTLPEPAALDRAEVWPDLQPVLDQELSRLPDKYRVPVVFCDLEGKTRRDAARQLGIPEGTLSGRLTTARRLLAKRLARHGFALSAGALAAALSPSTASACVPPPLVVSTVKTAALSATGSAATAGVVSTTATLPLGVLKTMLLSKLRIALVCLAIGAVGGTSLLTYRAAAQKGETSQAAGNVGPSKTEARVVSQSPGPAEQLKVLIAEYEAARQVYLKATNDGDRLKTPPEEHKKATQLVTEQAEHCAAGCLALAEKYPKEPVALDALLWVVSNTNARRLPENANLAQYRSRAMKLIQRDHLRREKLGPLIRGLAIFWDPQGEKLTHEVLAKNPHRSVQAQALLAIAQMEEGRAHVVRELQKQPERVTSYERAFGKEVGQALLKADPDHLRKEAQRLYERLAKEYADVPDPQVGTLGKRASLKLEVLRRPLAAGQPAPQTEGEDLSGKKIKLSDYRGKVVLLVFTGDWCAACSALYPQQRSLLKKFAGKPFALVDVNSDLLLERRKKINAKENITWRSFQERDCDGPFATRWGIEAWPTLFLIDPKGVIRKIYVGSPGEEVLVKELGDLIEGAQKQAQTDPVADGKPLSEWIKALEAKDEEKAIQAAKAISQLGPKAKAAVPALRKAMTRKGPPDLAAAEALWKVDREVFTQILKDPKGGQERWAAVLSLCNIGPAAKELAPLVLKMAANKKDRDREHALWALGLIGADPADALPVLMDALQEGGQYARMLAAQALGDFGSKAKDALPVLYQALQDPDAQVRVDAARTVWKIERKTEKVLPVLTAALKDVSGSGATQRAVFGLRDIGSKAREAFPALLELWKSLSGNPKNQTLTEQAATALKAIDAKAAAKAGVK